MQNERKDSIIIGAALFAMFFGAGNLIFPPALGLAAGDNWLLCFSGFFVTGIILPIMGVLTVAKVGGTINTMADKVHPVFSKILSTVVVLAIGPLLAIPRTGATVFEIGVHPAFPAIPAWLVSVVYFSVTLIFVIKPSGIMDKIGKILTPILLLVISTIIFKGVTSPIGTAIQTGIDAPFSNGFTQGYQTMDALGAVLLGGMVLIAIKEKGYTAKKVTMRIATKAGLIAGGGLTFVYGGLLFLGATGSGVFAAGMPKTQLILGLTNSVLGSLGQVGLSIAVSAACLTTSIGLTAIVGNFFVDFSKGKLSYKSIVISTTVFSAVMSVVGVEAIISLAVPLLTIVYPLVIILIGMNFFGSRITNSALYVGAIAGALPISLIEALKGYSIFKSMGFEGLYDLTQTFPLASYGFSWIVPSVICAVVASMLIKIPCESTKTDVLTA